MGVQDVNIPTARQISEIKGGTPKNPTDEATFWETKQRAAAAQRMYESEMAQIQRLANAPPADTGPFKVQGSINLGDINFASERQQLSEQIRNIQADANKRIDQISQTADNYREQVNQIRMQAMENTMKAQIDNLQRTIADAASRGNSNQGGLLERLSEVEKIAEKLGFGRGGAPTPASQGIPPIMLLEMKKMEIDNARADREFQWKMEQDRRQWDLKMKEFDRQSKLDMAKLGSENERNQMLAALPETLGAVIARGLADGGGAASPNEEPHVTQAAAKPQSYHLEAPAGEAGTTQCPQCGSPIAVGANATRAVCAKCRFTAEITRIPREPGEPEAQPPAGSGPTMQVPGLV